MAVPQHLEHRWDMYYLCSIGPVAERATIPNKSAKRLPVRQLNAATQARAMEQVKEEDLLHTGDDLEDDLPPLEQLTKPNGRK